MKSKRKYARKISIAFFVFVTTFTIVYRQTYISGSDYYFHMEWANELQKNIWIKLPYPMWHCFVWIWKKFGAIYGSMSIQYACAIVTSLVNTFSYLCIVRVLQEVPYSELLGGVLCLVGPIYLPWFSGEYYVGQGSPNIWHNPTNIMVKPFAIISFAILLDICQLVKTNMRVDWKKYFGLVLGLTMSALAKPSFLQGIIPAFGIFAIINLLIYRKREKFFAYFKICMCFLPATLILLYQFYISFYYGTDEGGIGFGWMKVIGITTKDWRISFILVLGFPLLYAILNIKKLYNKTEFQLCVLFLVCSYLEYACLYEKGIRMAHGNFAWASQLAYAIVWIYASKSFFLDWKTMNMSDRVEKGKNTLLLILFGIHLICGIYYTSQLLSVEGMWY